MNSVTKKIQDKIVNPADHIRRSFTMAATVTKTNERNNLCSIEFVDKDGYKSNKDNVPVKIYMPGFIGWFPTEGELVEVQQSENEIWITGKFGNGYSVDTRPGLETKKDMLTTSFVATMAGMIF